MEIFEKIRMLREKLKLSRAEFAQAANISANTLLAIESKGNSPRSDILEKIARTWPVYARWLLVGDSEIFLTVSDKSLHWVDVCDAAESGSCIIKASKMGKLLLVVKGGHQEFGAIILVNKQVYGAASTFTQLMEANEIVPAILVKPEMGWETGRAIEKAETFREWMCSIDPKILRDAEIVSVGDYYLDDSLKSMRLNTSLIHPISHVSVDKELTAKMYDWKNRL